jgi:undecaprenyl-diphosphatase
MAETKDTTGRKAGVALLVSLALAAGVLIFLSWLAEEVLEGDTRLFDEAVRASVNRHAQPRLTDAMRVVTYLGSTAVVWSLGACAFVALYLARRRRAALLLLVTMAGAAFLNATLKLSFHRARPEPFFDIAAPASYSFPSGHALFSFCLFGTLAAVVSRRVRGTAARVAVWASAALVVTLVGLSRIYLGVHYPSDVLAGYAAGFVWVTSVALVDGLLRRRGRESPE